MEERLLKALKHIPNDEYEIWLKVGMALKHEGYSCAVWEDWSRNSDKYHEGDCQTKWDSFNESTGAVVTGGTIMNIAKEHGYTTSYSSEGFGWDDVVEAPDKDYKLVDGTFVQEEQLPPIPKNYDGAADLREYLSILFQPDEYVCYCDRPDRIEGKSDGKEKKPDKFVPRQSIKSRTAGELIKSLEKGFDNASICADSDGGGYIKFNPIDGKGEGNGNITRWNYCLVESDHDTVEKQYALYKAMNLPIAALVYSGGKSLHAIVHVDAVSPHQYRERVNFLYEFCKKNGLRIDEQDKNESRYSRLPGVKRHGIYQRLIATGMGPQSYDDWKVWADDQNDNLPDDELLSDIWDDLPPLRPVLIDGILRQGHKLLLTAPSKAGKSFAMMELSIAIAAGESWLGHKCAQGDVLYINLELDRPSVYQRFSEQYAAMGLDPKKSFHHLRVWNLRGRAVPMSKLAPSIIRRYKGKGITAIIIDPIYKVITGDENNATEMAQFCSYFDAVAFELDAAIIYVHHHSKGAVGKYTKAVDRSSGSGVFARDPDAIVDLTELEITQDMATRYREQVPKGGTSLTAWEMTTTLREFAPCAPQRLWFDYPRHVVDEWNFLALAKNGTSALSGVGVGKKQRSQSDWERIIDEAYDFLSGGDDTEIVHLKKMVNFINNNDDGIVSAEKTILNQIQYTMKYKQNKFNGEIYIMKR